MEMEFYVNTDMHVYVYVCLRDDSRDLEAGACTTREGHEVRPGRVGVDR